VRWRQGEANKREIVAGPKPAKEIIEGSVRCLARLVPRSHPQGFTTAKATVIKTA
jgi:hypothetical protein